MKMPSVRPPTAKPNCLRPSSTNPITNTMTLRTGDMCNSIVSEVRIMLLCPSCCMHEVDLPVAVHLILVRPYSRGSSLRNEPTAHHCLLRKSSTHKQMGFENESCLRHSSRLLKVGISTGYIFVIARDRHGIAPTVSWAKQGSEFH
jgi:hypothetical protein